MVQVVDLEGSPSFRSLDVTLISISTDSTALLAQAVAEYGVESPHLSDASGEIVRAYGADRWAMASGEPGHTFVLVGGDGRVRWIRDYGAPENGGLMYVEVEELVAEVEARVGR